MKAAMLRLPGSLEPQLPLSVARPEWLARISTSAIQQIIDEERLSMQTIKANTRIATVKCDSDGIFGKN
jgi:hypothetical protein